MNVEFYMDGETQMISIDKSGHEDGSEAVGNVIVRPKTDQDELTHSDAWRAYTTPPPKPATAAKVSRRAADE